MIKKHLKTLNTCKFLNAAPLKVKRLNIYSSTTTEQTDEDCVIPLKE